MSYVRGTAEFTGKVRADKKVVDGIVRYDIYDRVTLSGNTTETEDSWIMDYSGINTFVKINNLKDLQQIKPSTEYTFEYEILANPNNVTLSIFQNTDDVFNGVLNINNGAGTHKILLTSKTIFSNCNFYFDGGDISGELEISKTFKIYEGNYITDPLPTSGQPVYGNSLIAYDNPTIYREQQANVGLTNDGFNRDDPTSLVTIPIPVPQNDTVDNNQQYTKVDEYEQLTYSESLEEPCYTEALKYEDMNEPLFDSEGEPLFDSEGSRLYALKEGVERI